MAEVMEYASKLVPRRSKWLMFLANCTLAFPVVLLGGFYGVWLGAWVLLGHPPRAVLDDPKNIAGLDWVDNVVGVIFILECVAALIGAGVTIVYTIMGKMRPLELAVRAMLFVCLWAFVIGLAVMDSIHVLEWYMD